MRHAIQKLFTPKPKPKTLAALLEECSPHDRSTDVIKNILFGGTAETRGERISNIRLEWVKGLPQPIMEDLPKGLEILLMFSENKKDWKEVYPKNQTGYKHLPREGYLKLCKNYVRSIPPDAEMPR